MKIYYCFKKKTLSGSGTSVDSPPKPTRCSVSAMLVFLLTTVNALVSREQTNMVTGMTLSKMESALEAKLASTELRWH